MKLKDLLAIKEDGFTLVDVMIGMIVMSIGMGMVVFFGIVPTAQKDQVRTMAKNIEAWSVSNPASPIAHEVSFPLEQFLRESEDAKGNSSTEYTVHRLNSEGQDLICFTGSSLETRAYSYTADEILDSKICESN